ncbi:MAG: response regulator [Planctomycetota bacterium]|nr:response regulator [Planctomycetota bacterium]
MNSTVWNSTTLVRDPYVDIEDRCDRLEADLANELAFDTRLPVAHVDISTSRIMFVDDEPINFKVVRKYLKDAGYQCFTATSDSTCAMDLLRAEPPDVLLLDLMMPQVSGLEILRQLRSEPASATLPVIILTATYDRTLRQSALELGATDFIRKPVDPTDLLPRVQNALAMKAYQDHLKNQAEQLEAEVRRRTAELEASRLEVIHCLGRAAEFRDNDTGHHIIRVGRYVGVIAAMLGLDEQTVALLEQAAPLHDMGKIGIPDSILLKPGRLDEEEVNLMRKHTEYGRKIVSTVESDEWVTLAEHAVGNPSLLGKTQSPLLQLAASIAATHHERWDGTGYSLGLSGEDIPIEGRITAVADVFDALTSKRPYKPAFDVESALQIMRDGRGTHFDPRVLDAFLSRIDDILAIKQELADAD